MIKRDSSNIIVQHSPDPSYSDGGDSSNRTALMAFIGSITDQKLIHLFVKGGLGCRHPSQPPYNDPRSWTRDQLIPTIAALHGTSQAQDLFWGHFKRGFFCQNSHTIDLAPKPWYQRDILSPSHIGHLIMSAQIYPLYPLLLISWPWLVLDLLWSTKVKPFEEQNQIICMLGTAGVQWLKAYVWLHPDYKKATRDYWGGWRDQVEIGEAIIKYIEERM